MEKMVLLLLAMCPVGSNPVHLRLNSPSSKYVGVYPETLFLSVLLPAVEIENFKKISTRTIHLNIPDFIFHVKNTSKIFFSPGLKPKAPVVNRFLKQSICYALPFTNTAKPQRSL
jgi:hypothetical protein